MSRNKKHSGKLPPGPGKNPFRVPEGYFESFGSRLGERIREQAEEDQSAAGNKKIRLRPYLSLAAAIIGVALVTSLVIQYVTKDQAVNKSYYDISLIDKSGIIQDEATLIESLGLEEDTTMTEWEQETMNYLASNEVDLEGLLASN